VVHELEALINNPNQIIQLMAKALPGQSGYFLQLLIVSTCMGSLIELFRVVPLVQSVLRANFGRRLTEKERRHSVGILRPLSTVDKVYFSRVQSRYLLYFMILFVYTTISPLVNWFCVFLFLFASCVYRYQFVFNYPDTPDSGGEVWLYFVRVILACILIAQLTIVGFLALKHSAIGAGLMIPLVVVTCLFMIYLGQRHFKIGKHLPARACLSQDMANHDDDVDYDEFKNQYKNPALMARFLDADWDSGKPMPNRSVTFAVDDGGATVSPVEKAGYDGFVNDSEEQAAENQRILNDAEAKDESFFGYVFRVLSIK
jgi:Calcium-dependent channel, 7TM region, putative phosphate